MRRLRVHVPVMAALALALAFCVTPAFADDSSSAAASSGTDLTTAPLEEEQPEEVVEGLPEGAVAMWRLYNPYSGEHFYTAAAKERDSLVKEGWKSEGVGWFAPETSSTPVYRLYNKNGGEHHYTTDASERDSLVNLGWKSEGVGWYSYDSGYGVGLFRDYNPNAFANNHNYTLSSQEHAFLVNAGWIGEGAAWCGMPAKGELPEGWYYQDGAWRYYRDGAVLTSQWMVTDNSPAVGRSFIGMQRYWLDADGKLAIDRLVDPANSVDAGCGYMAFATPGAAVVRGKFDNMHGRVYVADNDGRLETTVGWCVTNKYDGDMQRYYFDGSMHAAKSGSFTVDGKQYYGWGGQGYVARNTRLEVDGKRKIADNDGVLSDDPQVASMLAKAQGYSSPSRYLLMVDIDDPLLIVFEGSRGAWRIKYIWDCCTGLPTSPTVVGVFSVGAKGYSFGEDHGYSCYYWTQFYGDYLFHTRLYYAGTRTLLDPNIGIRRSMGCVRLYDECAIWIQDNCPTGTTVVCTY